MCAAARVLCIWLGAVSARSEHGRARHERRSQGCLFLNIWGGLLQSGHAKRGYVALPALGGKPEGVAAHLEGGGGFDRKMGNGKGCGVFVLCAATKNLMRVHMHCCWTD